MTAHSRAARWLWGRCNVVFRFRSFIAELERMLGFFLEQILGAPAIRWWFDLPLLTQANQPTGRLQGWPPKSVGNYAIVTTLPSFLVLSVLSSLHGYPVVSKVSPNLKRARRASRHT